MWKIEMNRLDFFRIECGIAEHSAVFSNSNSMCRVLTMTNGKIVTAQFTLP